MMGGLFAFQLSADTLGNALYLYRKIDWYDKLTHFTGGATAGALIILLLSYFSRRNQWRISVKTLIIFSVSLALLLGVFYEFWEYFAYSVLNYKFVITGLTDTIHDLLFDFLGNTASILILTAILKRKGYFSASSIDSSAK
jgi:ABC-type Fe3+-siderophore transport system permease subunit